MKKYSCELKRDNCGVKYIVTADSKEDAIKKISSISGEKITKVKEEIK